MSVVISRYLPVEMHPTTFVHCAGCYARFPVDHGQWAPAGPQVFVCTGCAEAAIDPRHSRSREVLERLAAALRHPA